MVYEWSCSSTLYHDFDIENKIFVVKKVCQYTKHFNICKFKMFWVFIHRSYPHFPDTTMSSSSFMTIPSFLCNPLSTPGTSFNSWKCTNYIKKSQGIRPELRFAVWTLPNFKPNPIEKMRPLINRLCCTDIGHIKSCLKDNKFARMGGLY